MSKKHDSLHRYQLINIGKGKEYKVYHCNLPNCSHYMLPERMFNVVSLCNRCNMPFEWNKDKNRRQVKPHCEACTKNKVASDVKKPNSVDKNAIATLVGSILSNARKS